MKVIDHCTGGSKEMPLMITTSEVHTRQEWFKELNDLNKVHSHRKPQYRLLRWQKYNFHGQEPRWGLIWLCLECHKDWPHQDRWPVTPEPAHHTAWHDKRAIMLEPLTQS